MTLTAPTGADLRSRLAIPADRLDELNALFLDPDARIVSDLLAVVDRYGTPEEINRKAREAGALPALLDRVRETRPDYLADLEWLDEQRERGMFVSEAAFRRAVLGDRADTMTFRDDLAVTLEVSSLQYFGWVIAAARRALSDQSLMPGRWIRVRKMREQEADGDLAAVSAAMQIIGASVVETLDTKGTDGSNVHLDGPATITGYFGGVGQPNDHPLLWVDEYLHYYTTYGVRQVLNLNPGTVLAGYLLHRLGVDIEFKISVFMGNDNPFAGLWTLLGARLFAREDGSTPLVGFNWSNSVNNETLEIAAQVRQILGLEQAVRFEHHITETQKSIVRQPYDRREELMRARGPRREHLGQARGRRPGGRGRARPPVGHPGLLPGQGRGHRQWRLGRPGRRLRRQARRHQSHGPRAHGARPQLRGGAQPAPLSRAGSYSGRGDRITTAVSRERRAAQPSSSAPSYSFQRAHRRGRSSGPAARARTRRGPSGRSTIVSGEAWRLSHQAGSASAQPFIARVTRSGPSSKKPRMAALGSPERRPIVCSRIIPHWSAVAVRRPRRPPVAR